MVRARLLRTLLLGLFLAAPAAAAAQAPKKVLIEMWLKRPGASSADARGNLETIDVAGLAFEQLTSFDVQYGREVTVRGMHLRDLLSVYRPIPESVDTLLLHFNNGMVVPVNIHQLRQNLEIFLALSYRDGKEWKAAFPEAPADDDGGPTSALPTAFGGNKLVVGKAWRQSHNDFTPWRYVDSLVGIELVESGAYYAQLRPASGAAKSKGNVVYVQRCQFCHGIGGQGASSGPDFVRVMVGYGVAEGKKTVDRLYEQVRSPRGFGPDRIHRMPEQGDFTRTEAKDLVQWVEAVSGRSLTPYQPTYDKAVRWRRN